MHTELQRVLGLLAGQEEEAAEARASVRELRAAADRAAEAQAQVTSLREEVRVKDEELTRTLALATDLNAQRGG